MSRGTGGLGHRMWGERKTGSKPPRTVHLRVGADTRFPGPACGIDTHTHNRSGATPALTLTDDPERVTCKQCHRSLAFKNLTEGK